MMNGIIFCVFVNISHFSSTDSFEVMSKRTQKADDEFGLAKTRHESQFPLSSRSEEHHRTGRPVVDAHSSSFSEWNVDKD